MLSMRNDNEICVMIILMRCNLSNHCHFHDHDVRRQQCWTELSLQLFINNANFHRITVLKPSLYSLTINELSHDDDCSLTKSTLNSMKKFTGIFVISKVVERHIGFTCRDYKCSFTSSFSSDARLHTDIVDKMTYANGTLMKTIRFSCDFHHSITSQVRFE